MGNITFEAMETEGTEVERIDDSLEEYRFLFIHYLDVLADLLELYSNFVAVDRVKMILEHGWRRDNLEIVEIQEQAAIQAEFHYKKELLQMNKRPMSPNLLEMMFRFRRKSLMLITPFPL